MSSDLKIFQHEEFGKVRTVTIDGKPYFVGVDVARILEYARPSDAVIDNCAGIGKFPIPTHNRYGAEVLTEMNVIPEGDVYRLITQAAKQSKNLAIKEKAKKFERWIYDEILPDVRQFGMYADGDVLMKLLAEPETFIKIITAYADEKKRRQEAEKKIEADKPKVIFSDAVSASKTAISVNEMAKLLRQRGVQFGQNRFFSWLRENGYLINRKGQDYNLPTQYSMEKGLFEIKEYVIAGYDRQPELKFSPKVTPKGQIYFVDRFLNASGNI